MNHLLGQGKAVSAALTGGFHLAFWVCGAIALLALPATATLYRRPRPLAAVRDAGPVAAASETARAGLS